MGRKEALEKSEGTWENERDVGTDDDDQQENGPGCVSYECVWL